MMTRIELARRILTELYCLDELLPSTHGAVVQRARKPKHVLEHEYDLAVAASQSVNRTVILS